VIAENVKQVAHQQEKQWNSKGSVKRQNYKKQDEQEI
jgi:hypothetical protein